MPHKTILPNVHADGKGYLVHVAGDVHGADPGRHAGCQGLGCAYGAGATSGVWPDRGAGQDEAGKALAGHNVHCDLARHQAETRRMAQAEEAALVDELSGLWNRRVRARVGAVGARLDGVGVCGSGSGQDRDEGDGGEGVESSQERRSAFSFGAGPAAPTACFACYSNGISKNNNSLPVAASAKPLRYNVAPCRRGA